MMENNSSDKEAAQAEGEGANPKTEIVQTDEGSGAATGKGEVQQPENSAKEELIENLTSENSLLKKSLDEKESIIRDYESLLKKIQADFDNYRKRIEREREEYSKLVVERIIRKLINVVDDLERGLDETKNGNNDPFRAGIEKIRENMMQILTEEGLREIPTNKLFDPYYHEALVVQENSEFGDNEIMEVYQKGYTLGTKVIRPAKVRVSRRVESRQSQDESEKDV
jgi:molecular chaperone GrpE